jgi:hypothetical protein
MSCSKDRKYSALVVPNIFSIACVYGAVYIIVAQNTELDVPAVNLIQQKRDRVDKLIPFPGPVIIPSRSQ